MRLRWSVPAQGDLRAIYSYLDQRDARAAVKVIQAIRAKAALLGSFPELGPIHDTQLRRLSVSGTSYVILYELLPDHVGVLRVFDSRQNWQQSLDEP